MKRARSLVTILLAIAAQVAVPALAVRALPAPGDITALRETVPNHFIAHGPPAASQASRSFIRAAADTVNNLYFEFYEDTCDDRQQFHHNTAVYDLTTFRLLRTGCVSHLPIGTRAKNGTALKYVPSTGLAARAVTAAFDPADGLFFIVANVTGASTSSGPTDNAATQAAHAAADPHQIAVFNERTLELVDVWTLPIDAPSNISGLTYHAPSGELIVTTDTTQNPVRGAAVHVLSYDIRATLGRAASVTPAPLWNAPINSCIRPIQPKAASIDAHRSLLQPKLYVPCSIAYTGHADDQPASYRSGVVTMTLTTGGVCPAGRQCPDTGIGSETTAVAPTTMNGFVFDTGSDRAFGINNSATTGITVLGYDGPTNKFLGRTSVGSGDDANNSSVAVDQRTGRLYGSGIAGLTTIDGRRAPLSTGSLFPQFAGITKNINIVAVPPDRQHPYTRVLLPLHRCGGARKDQDCVLDNVTVLADRLPVTADPPTSALDARTYSGPLAGLETTLFYSGEASGYGTHVDWIGSAQTVVNNATDRDERFGQQLLDGDRDLLAGYVEDVTLTDSNSAATASSLGDGNGSTQRGFENLTATPNPPSGAPTLPSTPTPNPSPSSSPSPVVTWPYPTLACGYPGSVGHDESAETDTATVKVVCDADDRKTSADAAHGGHVMTSAGGPTVTVGASETSAHVTPPNGDTGVTSTVTARARGLRVDLGAGIGAFTIGEVSSTATASATGRPGGAHTTYDEPVLRDVSVTVGGTRVELCDTTCAHYDDVIRAVNETFAGYVSIYRPEPDRDLLKGSPGGYKAAVQADPNAMYGDIQFNHMSPEEAALIPALRIVVYNDGNALSRVVIDLAGVKVDANQGVQPVPRYTDMPTPPVDVPRARELAIPPPLNGFSPGGNPTTPLTGTTTIVGGAVGRAIMRALHGFAFLLRRPAELLSVLALLGLLVAPALLMARRRLWTREVFAHPSG